VISAIPKHLLSIAKESDTFNKNFFTSNDNTFQLNDSVQINFEKARSRDFYKLFTSKTLTHTQEQTGPKRWSENLSLTKDSWSKNFKSLKNVCKDTKLKEFQFKFIHRVVVTRKNYSDLASQPTMNAYIVGIKARYLERTFAECLFTRTFVKRVLQWFNETNSCQICPTTEELLFGIFSCIRETAIKRKFNYTTLAMRHYIYSNKINSKAIYFQEFINKLLLNNKFENITELIFY